MSDQWTDRLSEYLDGELKGSERALLEAHLERCEDCAETLAGLRRVLRRARTLEDRPPAADLWAGVATRIGAPTRRSLASRRRFTFSLPQLLAAGVALAVLSGSGAWLLHPASQTAPCPSPRSGSPVPPGATMPRWTTCSGSWRTAASGSTPPPCGSWSRTSRSSTARSPMPGGP